MNNLTARERRLIALGLLFLALAVVWLAAVSPILSGFARRTDERAQLAQTLERDQRLLRTVPVLRARQLALAANGSDYAFQTGDGGAALAAAEAQMAAEITAGGGGLRAVRSQPSPRGEVRLRADAALTLPALVRLLQSLSNGRPYGVFQALSIARSDATPGQLPGALEVRIDVAYAHAAPVR